MQTNISISSHIMSLLWPINPHHTFRNYKVPRVVYHIRSDVPVVMSSLAVVAETMRVFDTQIQTLREETFHKKIHFQVTYKVAQHKIYTDFPYFGLSLDLPAPSTINFILNLIWKYSFLEWFDFLLLTINVLGNDPRKATIFTYS